MTTTDRLHAKPRPRPTRSARIGSWTWADPVVRAWLFVALIPVFGLLAVGLTSGVTALGERRPVGFDLPVSAGRAGDLAGTVLLLVPCLLAVRYGNRARAGRDPRGVPPMAVGGLLACWWLVGAVLPFLRPA
jgi:hypothetical protein